MFPLERTLKGVQRNQIRPTSTGGRELGDRTSRSTSSSLSSSQTSFFQGFTVCFKTVSGPQYKDAPSFSNVCATCCRSKPKRYASSENPLHLWATAHGQGALLGHLPPAALPEEDGQQGHSMNAVKTDNTRTHRVITL